MASNSLRKSVRRASSFTAAALILASLPFAVLAETDACTLLAPAQVSAAAGGGMSDGKHVTPTFVKTCTWTPTGTSKIASITLNLQTADYYDRAKQQATMAAAVGGKGNEVKAERVGDDAYYFVTGDQPMLFVKKGAASFKVSVYARLPAAEKAAMELKLAKDVVPKL